MSSKDDFIHSLNYLPLNVFIFKYKNIKPSSEHFQLLNETNNE